jgi:hypothetical protein
VIAVLCVILLVVRLATALAFGLLGILFHERRARSAFRRALRRRGLTDVEVEVFTAGYQAGIGLRDVVRAVKPRTT